MTSIEDPGAGVRDAGSGVHKELAGRVAVVTGSARNIGRAIALALAQAGAAVIVNARTSARAAAEVAEEIHGRLDEM